MKILSEEEFDEKYELIDNPNTNEGSFNNKFFETYGEDLDFVISMTKENRVITIIESHEEEENEFGETIGYFYYITGYHIVNRYGYLVTELPLDREFEVKIT